MTLDEIRKAAGQSEHARYWFSEGAMAGFGTQLEPETYGPDEQGRWLFVTTEDTFDRSERRATVRAWNPHTEQVETVGEFNEHEDAHDASIEACVLTGSMERDDQ